MIFAAYIAGIFTGMAIMLAGIVLARF